METPSSMRMATRSQTSFASQKSKKEDSMSKPRPNQRSVLIDITNDSPIVGLATGSLSEKNRVREVRGTPGSGEALLRGQVKTLLQKVEEGAEFVGNTSRIGFRVLLDLPGPSPVQILAPTPANTPLVIEANSVKNSTIQEAEAGKPEEKPQESLINRALLFDSPGKSETTDSSSVVSSSHSNQDDSSSSAWSMQVNVEEEGGEIEDFDEVEEEYGDADGGGSWVDEMCEGLSRMRVEDDGKGAGIAGKHTRFVYNSDGEMEGVEVVGDDEGETKNASPGVLLLKGMPAPEGKHLRFRDEGDEE